MFSIGHEGNTQPFSTDEVERWEGPGRRALSYYDHQHLLLEAQGLLDSRRQRLPDDCHEAIINSSCAQAILSLAIHELEELPDCTTGSPIAGICYQANAMAEELFHFPHATPDIDYDVALPRIRTAVFLIDRELRIAATGGVWD